jgi:hypothetical protein
LVYLWTGTQWKGVGITQKTIYNSDDSLAGNRIVSTSSGKTLTFQPATIFTNGLTVTGSVNGNFFVKSGGTSSQFLKADGTIDASTYVPNTRSISTTSPIVGGGDLSANRTISIPAATSLIDGYLTSTDFATFNNKQAALSGTGFVKISGTTISYDNNTYITGNQSITLSGDISGSGTTAITTTIGANKVTKAMLAEVATASIRGRVTAGTGNVEDLTSTQATTLINVFSSTLKGLAPASGGGTTNFLRADGTWVAPTASIAIGNTITSATAGSILFAGTSGVLAQNNANFFWDNTNFRLGIGTATPTRKLEVVGSDALINTLSLGRGLGNIQSNAAFGFQALNENTSGDGNVAIGYIALKSNTSAYANTAIGSSALTSTTTGHSNTAIGTAALLLCTSNDNVAIGVSAAAAITSATNIVAIGKGAFQTGIAGNNIMIGTNAGKTLSNASATNNILIGHGLGDYSSTMSGCTAIGLNAILTNTTGTNNIGIGNDAGRTTTTGSNNIFIGVGINPVLGSESNRTFIGNSSTVSTWLGGNLLLGSTTDSGERIQINGTAKITNKMSLSAGTTSAAQINLASSTAPTSPNNGDIWFDGTNLFMRIGGVTKTFTIL